MKLAIVGSRHCPPINIDGNLPFIPSAIVSGGAIGADSYAKHYAVKNNITLIEFLPDYKQHGRKAPILRNIQIVDIADFVLAFWDGKSRGTKFTIDYAIKKGVPYKIVLI